MLHQQKLVIVGIMKHTAWTIVIVLSWITFTSYAWRPTFPLLSTRRRHNNKASSRREFKFDVADDGDLASSLTSRIITTTSTTSKHNNIKRDDDSGSSRSGSNGGILPMPFSSRQEEIWNMMIEESSKLASSSEQQQKQQELHKFRMIRHKEPVPIVSSAEELRSYVLDRELQLKEIQLRVKPQNFTHEALFDHDVVQLILQRYHQGSKPGRRPANDTRTLALAMEGGGMRGAVSAGMAAALACLGLTDTFDKIYGSSAGSVIGAYIVSRQMCMDVYVDILPAAKRKFVCLRRLVASIGMTALDALFGRLFVGSGSTGRSGSIFSQGSEPGMNISFVLDGIMHPEWGLRPLDFESFMDNDQYQPLRIASSYEHNGRLISHCFGRDDFLTARGPSNRHGIYACLQASMTVPGAAGPPVRVTDIYNHTRSYFDAFCCEPLPYRSAVAEGATHCLVLCSRPDGFQPQTQPTLYEKGVAPNYFHAHGEDNLAAYFKNGGQQYIYAEDLLTLMEGQLDRGDGVPVPPTTILYGVQPDNHTEHLKSSRESWRKAHLLPIKAPLGTEELATLEQGRTPVVEAVRSGFAIIYDIFAPALDLNMELSGKEAAGIIFPDDSDSTFQSFLNNDTVTYQSREVSKDSPIINAELLKDRPVRNDELDKSYHGHGAAPEEERLRDVALVLDSLPGLKSGAFGLFSDSVRRSHDLV